MSTGKSKLYSAVAILFSLIVLASGAAKLFRGVNTLANSDSNPNVRKTLEEIDAAVEVANRDATSVATTFQELLADFDKMGPQDFRAEKRQACEKLRESYTAICNHLTRASSKATEVAKLEVNGNLQGFLREKSKSYDLLAKYNAKNIDIISALLDESSVDANAIVAKIQTIAESRAVDEKAANEASAKADAIVEQSKTKTQPNPKG